METFYGLRYLKYKAEDVKSIDLLIGTRGERDDVSNKLVLFANVDRRLVKVTDTENEVTDISKLHIPLLIEDLLEKEITTSEVHAASEYYWIKDF